MKTKTLSKKLTLTRQTITNLDNRQQEAVHGGIIVVSTKNYCCSLPVCGPTYCGSEWDCSC